MFFPLLQVVGGENLDGDKLEMGKLGYLVEGIESIGIPMTITTVLSIMIFFFVLKGIVYYANSIYKVIIQQLFVKKIRIELLRNLSLMSFKRFTVSDVGRIQNTMSVEVSRLSGAFRSYFSAIQSLIMLIVYMTFAFVLDSKFALMVSCGGVLTHFLYKLVNRYTVVASRKLTSFGNIYQGQLIQLVGFFKYLKATGKVQVYSKQLEKSIVDIEDSNRRLGFWASITEAVREPMLVIIISIVILIQVHYFGGNLGAMLISLLFFYRALTYLVGMQQNWNAFLAAYGSLENLKDFQKILKNNREQDGSIEMKKFNHKIELNGVNFWYDETTILKNINLKISVKESIAFVGESGSGKTTLVNLISGLISEDEGDLIIDGIPLKEIKKESYQNRIGYVSQDPVIFNDTIFNNITFWAKKTPDNINRFRKSIEQASLTDFLKELSEGEDTMLGNNGINLSGGQKQRISIARELFKDIDILILDEATSALDSEIEREIQQSIESLQGKYTILIVAHRLSTVRNVDKLIYMHKGMIEKTGGFDELFQNHPKFKKMVELQGLGLN